jgi:hypothetical protein
MLHGTLSSLTTVAGAETAPEKALPDYRLDAGRDG